MFNKIDVSGDGSVSMQELQARMESLPARSRGQWQAVMNEMDKDGSGEIEFVEFDSVVGKWIRAKLLLGLEAALELDEKTAKTVDREEQKQTQAELQPDPDLTPEPDPELTDVSSDIDNIELSEDEVEDLDASEDVGKPESKPRVDTTPPNLSGSVEDENFAFDAKEIDDLVASAGGDDLDQSKPPLETKPVQPPKPTESELQPEPDPELTDVSSDIDSIELSEDEIEDLDASEDVGKPESKPLVDTTPPNLSGSVEDENFAFDAKEIDDLVASAGGDVLDQSKPPLETKPVQPPKPSEPLPMPRQKVEPLPATAPSTSQPQPQPQPPARPLRQGGDSSATENGSVSRAVEKPKDNLLRWAQEKTRMGARMRSADATSEIPAPKGFRKGFVDGLAFCAILAAEGHLDWAEVSVPAGGAEGGMLNVEQKMANLRLAFGVADRVLGLDGTMLDAQDMATDGQYDDKSVMTYVGELRKHLRKHVSIAESNIKPRGGTSMDVFDEDEINALISSAGAEI
eukprot:COSAG02_NODE_870_length_16337_cov_45.593608_5_plen_515_part_00